MTGEVVSEVHLEINDSKLISQEETDSPSDSGQGSCETIGPLSEQDSDEEIFVSRKLKSRKVLQESDSEREDPNVSPEKTTYDDAEEEDKRTCVLERMEKPEGSIKLWQTVTKVTLRSLYVRRILKPK